jgi:hypothetical protein
VRDRLEEFGDTTDVVLITFTDDDHLDEYKQNHSFPFPVLNDPERDLYRAYGFPRGSVRRVWSWGVWRKYAELIGEQGFGALKKASEDTLQLGGDVVIAPDGTLAWGFWSESPDDRPSVDDLIAAVREATPSPTAPTD